MSIINNVVLQVEFQETLEVVELSNIFHFLGNFILKFFTVSIYQYYKDNSLF